ncbi:hypothetical protein CTEN210_15646 [Chaetoceros tenuissimus]|uniref:Transmembrane protein n=1 Tax=Chaetoceros tenuissimus TaxID=426638 RepID=A0AAD3DA35_9STRA|nr:hypothetical protein CTEN210_15646 [Chaetoceros tenuissimus]
MKLQSICFGLTIAYCTALTPSFSIANRTPKNIRMILPNAPHSRRTHDLHRRSTYMQAAKSGSVDPEDSKCPVTQFGLKVSKTLAFADKHILSRLIRIGNHVPALMSLSYFGLISMASMMQMGPMANTCETATLSTVLTRTVGMTTNSQFASYFPTLVTPSSFVFLVWPLIAGLQLLTVTLSAIFPNLDEEFLTQKDLTCITIANLCSSAWLFASSNALPGQLPLASFLVLPLVPIFSGYPLRNKPQYVLWAYQVYSSFTTIASFLAFAVEIQHGGRIPVIGKVGAEVAASTFLFLYSMASLAVAKKSNAKKAVNVFALGGIIYKRLIDSFAVSTGFMSATTSLLFSFSFVATLSCWVWSLKEFFSSN